MNIGVISNRYIRVSEPLAYYGNRDTGVKCLCCKGVTKLVKRERLADFSIFQHTMEYTLQLVVRQHIAIERRYHIRTANSFLAVDGVQVFKAAIAFVFSGTMRLPLVVFVPLLFAFL